MLNRPGDGVRSPLREGRASAAGKREARVFAVLAALTALGPLSIDAYIPGLPHLADELHSSAWAVQLTVSSCLVGLAVGQLLAGPMSDALGRRRPLVVGLALYAAASALCAVAPTTGILVALRAVQGLGGAFALVISFAYVRDLHEGEAAARYFSLLMIVTGLAPVIAPLAGAQILDAWGWRAIFAALAASSAVLIACTRALPESRPPSVRQAWSGHRTAAVYAKLLRDRLAMGYVLTNALSFAALFAYISGSPFVLQNLHGLSAQQYSLVFAANAVGLIAGAQMSRVLVGRLGSESLLTMGVAGSSAAGLAVVTLALVGTGLWPLLAALFVVITGVGMVMPNATTLVLAEHGADAGAAAAVLGCAQFLLGGLAAPLVGLAHVHSALPMATVMSATTLAALATVVALIRPASRRRTKGSAEDGTADRAKNRAKDGVADGVADDTAPRPTDARSVPGADRVTDRAASDRPAHHIPTTHQ